MFKTTVARGIKFESKHQATCGKNVCSTTNKRALNNSVGGQKTNGSFQTKR